MRLRVRKADEHIVTQAFDISVILKGIDGLLEILGGLILLIVPLRDIRALLIWITGKELSEDPKDFFATHIVRLAHMLSMSAYNFTIAYLLIHGFVKVFLVFMLLRRQLWAYPTAIAVFTAFGVYQIYQFTFSHSILLLALTVLDVIVIALTSWEYTILRRRPRVAAAEVKRESA